MENLNYLFAAYSVVWVALFIYIFVLHRRLSGVLTELASLKGDNKSCGCK